MLKEYNDQQQQPLVLFDGKDASISLDLKVKIKKYSEQSDVFSDYQCNR